jgi:hypothetical protein
MMRRMWSARSSSCSASRAADVDDLEVLWEHCSFETPEEAAEAFHVGYRRAS